MDRDRFEKLVEDALDSLPRAFKKLIENVAVIVEDAPDRGREGSLFKGQLLGLYHGVPFVHRGPYYGNVPPDVIVIYQRPIESLCRTDEEVRDEVRETVLHEVGHYFGFSERELRDIERTKRTRPKS
jgi:predicted Zn-dependent protease with MMP-like domain